MFSIGASKIANTARENVSRYGNIAGQKVRLNNAIPFKMSILKSCFCFIVAFIYFRLTFLWF